MGKIPERWLPYRALGKIISGTRFVAFKVPLSERLNKSLADNERFSPDILIQACPKLSLVVDLTNTDRYYDKKDFTSNAIQYEKIFVPGRELPSSSIVERFFKVVDTFVNSSDNSESLIGVHCTHGVNRTGYFICRYMIQRLGFDPATALKAFQEGRGYPIERENYIRDLKTCYGKVKVHTTEETRQEKKIKSQRKEKNMYHKVLPSEETLMHCTNNQSVRQPYNRDQHGGERSYVGQYRRPHTPHHNEYVNNTKYKWNSNVNYGNQISGQINDSVYQQRKNNSDKFPINTRMNYRTPTDQYGNHYKQRQRPTSVENNNYFSNNLRDLHKRYTVPRPQNLLPETF